MFQINLDYNPIDPILNKKRPTFLVKISFLVFLFFLSFGSIKAQETVVVYAENFDNASTTQPWLPYHSAGWFAPSPQNVLEQETNHGKVLRVNLAAGDIGSDAGIGNYRMPLDSSYSELYVSFEYFLPSNFDYGYQDGNGGGKFSVSFAGGSMTAIPNNDGTNNDGWVSMLIFQNGNYKTYNYFKNGEFDPSGWPMGDVVANLVRGQWHRITIRIKMNNGDQANGIFEVFDNDVLAYKQTNAKITNAIHPDWLIEHLYFNVFFGGSSPCPVNQYIKYDNIIAFYYPQGSTGYRSGGSEAGRRLEIPSMSSYHPTPPNKFTPTTYTESSGVITSHCAFYQPIASSGFETSTIQVAGASSLNINVTKFDYDPGLTSPNSMQILNIYRGTGDGRTLVASYQRSNVPLQQFTISGNSATIEWQSGQGINGGFALNYSSNGSGSGNNFECANYVAKQGAVINIPIAPSNLRSTGTTTSSVSLSWNDNSSNETSFLLRRMNASNVVLNNITLSANTTQYTDNGLTSNTTYHYTVCAINNNIYSAESNNFSITTNLTPPNAPSNLQVTAVGDTFVYLAWTDNSNIETGFELQRLDPAGTLLMSIQLGANAVLYHDTNLVVNTLYQYRIRAVNSMGYSAFSSTVQATTTYTPPTVGIPQNLHLNYLNVSSLSIGWDPVLNADKYLIYKADNQTDYLLIAAINASDTSYIDNQIQKNNIYRYKLRSYGMGVYSNESQVLQVNTMEISLNKPANINVNNLKATSLTLTWEDSSFNESGYKIERRRLSDFETSYFHLPENSVSFSDSSLNPTELFRYRIKPFSSSDSTSGIAEIVVQTLSQAEEGREFKNLVAYYNFNHINENTVFDLSCVGDPLNLTLSDPYSTEILPDNGIHFESPASVESDSIASKIIDACGLSNEISLELWINTTDVTLPATLVSIGNSSEDIGIELQQVQPLTENNGKCFQVFLHTEGTATSGRPALIQNADHTGNTFIHLVYTHLQNGDEYIYINGNLVGQGFKPAALNVWNKDYKLIIGNNVEGTQPFIGSMNLCALYSQALSKEQINKNFLAGPYDGDISATPKIELRTSPNPLRNVCHVNIVKASTDLIYFNKLYYRVLDEVGNTVLNGELPYSELQNSDHTIDFSSCMPGIYLISFYTSQEIIDTQRVIKLD